MSRTAKATLTASIIATTAIVYGVHYMQLKEAENMYMGVIKDDARTKAKRQKKVDDALVTSASTAIASSSSSPTMLSTSATTESSSGVAVPNRSLFERQVEYERNLRLQEELGREQGLRRSEEEKSALERERRSRDRI